MGFGGAAISLGWLTAREEIAHGSVYGGSVSLFLGLSVNSGWDRSPFPISALYNRSQIFLIGFWMGKCWDPTYLLADPISFLGEARLILATICLSRTYSYISLIALAMNDDIILHLVRDRTTFLTGSSCCPCRGHWNLKRSPCSSRYHSSGREDWW